MMRCSHHLILTMALYVGCGSVQSNNGDDAGGSGDFTLSATPSSISIPIASSGKVTVSIDRTGSPGDVTLAAQNLPNGLTAAFATNPVPAASNSTDVTFTAAPGSPVGTANVTLVGTSGSNQKTVTVAVTTQTITVAGTVRGKRSGVTVRLVGKAAVTSDANGNFSFSDVSPPYDLYTFGNNGLVGAPIPTVFYYRGLTRPDPVVNAPATFLLSLPPRRSTAALTGTTSTAPATMLTVWSTGGLARVTQTNAYSFTASWLPNANNSIDGTLYGFQFSTKPTGAPDAFTGYGSTNATLTLNTPATVNLTMAAPQSAALTGAVTSPSGFPSPTITLTQQLGTSSVALWSATTTVADSTIPLIAAGKAALSATATLDNAATTFVHPALAAATDVTFALPAPAVQTAPLNAATGVTVATPFTWDAPQNTIYQVNISSTSTTGTALAAYQLITTGPMAKIPVVPELALPLNQSFTWNVNGYGPSASIDDAASAAGLQTVSDADFTGQRHWFTNSTDRTFTTAP
jgi:hypothetical protein